MNVPLPPGRAVRYNEAAAGHDLGPREVANPRLEAATMAPRPCHVIKNQQNDWFSQVFFNFDRFPLISNGFHDFHRFFAIFKDFRDRVGGFRSPSRATRAVSEVLACLKCALDACGSVQEAGERVRRPLDAGN